MARGRFISTSISVDDAVADLASVVGLGGALFYTWLIAHLDVDGKQTGNPRKLKALIAPMIPEITPESIKNTLDAAEKLGLLKQYQHEGKPVVWFPNFVKHQVGLRPDREAKSRYGDYEKESKENKDLKSSGPTPELLRSDSGPTPENSGLSKVKLSKVKTSKTKQSEENEIEENQSWKEGQSISRGIDLLSAVAVWGWCTSLKQSNIDDFRKIQQGGEITHSEIVYARDKTNSKKIDDKVAYFLGIISRRRSEVAIKIPDETAPPAPKPAAWKEYKHLENQEEKENGLAGSSA